MYYVKVRILLGLLVMLTAFLPLLPEAIGQDDQLKLDRQVDRFDSDALSSEDQLIEFARRFQLPMGIELTDTGGRERVQPVHLRKTTVREVIQSILQQYPGHEFEVKDGIIHVFSPSLANDSRNFLNLQIREFSLTDANLIDASYYLKKSVWRSLHPDLNFGGGHGSGTVSDDGFDRRNISFSGQNLTVREILTRIAVANGNALWVVRLVPSRMMAQEPFFVQGPLAEEYRNTTSFIWQFIPLGKVAAQNKSQ